MTSNFLLLNMFFFLLSMLFVSLHLHRLHKISKIRNILSESDAEELVKEHGMKTESFRNLIN